MLDKKQFGQLIRDTRQSHNITLRNFAKLINKSPTYVSKIERGDFDPPSTETVINIANKLHLNADYLLCEIGRIPPVIHDIFIRRYEQLYPVIRLFDETVDVVGGNNE